MKRLLRLTRRPGQGQHGNIVFLAERLVSSAICTAGCTSARQLANAVEPEEMALRILRLDNAVGVEGHIFVQTPDGMALHSGCLNPGYPLPGHIRQAQFVLPKGTQWQGLRLKAEIEVKGMRYPVRWAWNQKLNEDGTLTLRSNGRFGS